MRACFEEFIDVIEQQLTRIESQIGIKAAISAIRISEFTRALELKNRVRQKMVIFVCQLLLLSKTRTVAYLSNDN